MRCDAAFLRTYTYGICCLLNAINFFIAVGKLDVTRLMLEAGAKVYHENSVGRTAAQMAAFVGTYFVMLCCLAEYVFNHDWLFRHIDRHIRHDKYANDACINLRSTFTLYVLHVF